MKSVVTRLLVFFISIYLIHFGCKLWELKNFYTRYFANDILFYSFCVSFALCAFAINFEKIRSVAAMLVWFSLVHLLFATPFLHQIQFEFIGFFLILHALRFETVSNKNFIHKMISFLLFTYFLAGVTKLSNRFWNSGEIINSIATIQRIYLGHNFNYAMFFIIPLTQVSMILGLFFNKLKLPLFILATLSQLFILIIYDLPHVSIPIVLVHLYILSIWSLSNER
jgi:hypothetical protein